MDGILPMEITIKILHHRFEWIEDVHELIVD